MPRSARAAASGPARARRCRGATTSTRRGACSAPGAATSRARDARCSSGATSRCPGSSSSDGACRRAEGSVVAPLATLGPLQVINPCRVVYVEDDDDLCAFGYGTLPGHVESGEERFEVRLEPSGRVLYEIAAFSRPAACSRERLPPRASHPAALRRSVGRRAAGGTAARPGNRAARPHGGGVALRPAASEGPGLRADPSRGDGGGMGSGTARAALARRGRRSGRCHPTHRGGGPGRVRPAPLPRRRRRTRGRRCRHRGGNCPRAVRAELRAGATLVYFATPTAATGRSRSTRRST